MIVVCFVQCVLMEMSVFLVVSMKMKAQLKSVSITFGDLWDRVNGVHQMQRSLIDNLDIPQKVYCLG